MSNRHVRVLLVMCLLAAPLVALGQAPAKVHRIAFLSPNTPPATWRNQPHYRAFLEGLHAIGYVEGQNLVIDFRSAENKYDRLPALVSELIALKPDVILVGTCGAPLEVTRRATRTIPIVVAACNDDIVAAGVVASLAHPGGNITGLQKQNPELAGKRLELLKEVLPKLSRVAVPWDPGYSNLAADWRALRTAANTLGVSLLPVEVRGPAEFEHAFAAMNAGQAEALITFSDALTFIHGRQLVELAAKNRLPVMNAFREITEAGGLLSYGPSIPEMLRRSATLVDKILKGAKPGDLPIEQPSMFELVINMKTAKVLGLTIPQSLLLRADRVIE